MVKITDSVFQFEFKDGGKSYFSYLWRRSEGNILFNHISLSDFWRSNLKEIEKLGGLKWVYLTHAGDADEGTYLFHKAFGTKMAGTEYEGEKVRKKCKAPLGKIIPSSTNYENGVKCIFAPGHCHTFTAFKFGDQRYPCVYTSDMFYQASQNKWKVTVPERLAKVGIESLSNIFDEKFEYLLPGLSAESIPGPYKLNAKGRAEMKASLQDTLRRKYKMTV
jgi:hypothetical protein